MRKYILRSNLINRNQVDYESQLNPQQLKAVTAGEGPILVIAGAGSGKTRTVIYRVAYLLESGVSPERILLVTFTNKAARDMLHRVELLLSAQAKLPWGGTFHHIGNLILRRYAKLLGYQNNYTIIDREDSKDLIQICLTDLGIETKKNKFPKKDVLLDIISLSVNTQKSISKVIKGKYPFFESLTGQIKKVAVKYQTHKKELNLMDFDDLLSNWKTLLVEHPQVRELYSENFFYILVDEYQDTNKIQGQIIDLLASYHHNLMVVGDDSQSIYSFRGANFVNIIDFPKRYPDAKIYKLERNYRSTPQILYLTNCVIAQNKWQFRKTLRSVKKGKSKPAVVPLRDVNQQAQFVAERILELVDEGKSLSEIAILYRSHYHCLEMQLELTRRGIPFVMRSGLRFFERAHVKDVIAYLKIIANPKDEISWKRVLKLLPGIGNISADKIWKHLLASNDPLKQIQSKDILSILPRKAALEWPKFAENISGLCEPSLTENPGGMIQFVLQKGYEEYLQGKYPDYRERVENLNQISRFARQYSSLQKFLSELALLGTIESEAGTVEERNDAVILSTVHQAKGLEWSVVFIIYLADGYFPSSRSLKSRENVEEERRLLYVATTRAKDELYLCYPITTGRSQWMKIMEPSRFLQELNPDTYEEWVVSEEVKKL